MSWHEGVLYVSGEDAARNQPKTFYQGFRFPKNVDPGEIDARYHTGVLEVRLPIATVPFRDQEIEVHG